MVSIEAFRLRRGDLRWAGTRQGFRQTPAWPRRDIRESTIGWQSPAYSVSSPIRRRRDRCMVSRFAAQVTSVADSQQRNQARREHWHNEGRDVCRFAKVAEHSVDLVAKRYDDDDSKKKQL